MVVGDKLNIRKYKDSDFELINSWYEKRNLQPVDKIFLSSNGYIVDDIVAVWLYKTDSSIAWIENLITNPDAKTYERSRSIDYLLIHVCNEARSMGFKAIIGLTKLAAVSNRCKSLGFKTIENYKFLSKSL